MEEGLATIGRPKASVAATGTIATVSGVTTTTGAAGEQPNTLIIYMIDYMIVKYISVAITLVSLINNFIIF